MDQEKPPVTTAKILEAKYSPGCNISHYMQALTSAAVDYKVINPNGTASRERKNVFIFEDNSAIIQCMCEAEGLIFYAYERDISLIDDEFPDTEVPNPNDLLTDPA